MKKIENQLRIAIRIINEYDFSLPLYRFLPTFFRQNKQMGSNDRKTASDLVYSLFRIGKAFQNLNIEERFLISQFLCHKKPNDFLSALQPIFNQKIELNTEEKLTYLKTIYPGFSNEDIFPYLDHFCKDLDVDKFIISHLVQPKLFIRTKSGFESKLQQIFNDNQIHFDKISDNCWSLKNSTKIEHLQFWRKYKLFEIQDWASAQIGNVLNPKANELWWDCCAASGGKSLMLLEKEPNINLVVSDVRSSILKNLKERFLQSGIENYTIKELDLTKPVLFTSKFDYIIADVPCSGSGTWGRTPEQLISFSEEQINYFSSLQRNIISNVIPHLKSGHKLIYITCSVFKEENEENIKTISKQFNLDIEHQELISGFEKQADSMFFAILKKQ